jgi:hypothetical protein
VHKVFKDQLVHKVFKVQLVQLVHKVFKVQLVQLVQPEPPDQQAHRGLLALTAR